MSPRLESLRKAVVGFRAALEAFETDISRDAAIQRFEFCFELAWKSIQDMFLTTCCYHIYCPWIL